MLSVTYCTFQGYAKRDYVFERERGLFPVEIVGDKGGVLLIRVDLRKDTVRTK